MTPLLAATSPGSFNHLAAVAVCAVIVAAVVALGRHLRRRGIEHRMRDALGVLGLASWLAITGYYMHPSQFAAFESFPLHVCDVANLIASLVMLTRGRVRVLRSVLYFWAFGLTLQGFITPVVTEGPTHPRYWLFWMNHTVVVGYAIYDFAVAGYRPTWRDLGVAVVASAGYVAVVLPLNLAMGWNYGYVGPGKPGAPTLIDLLGPWPLRLIPLFGLALLAFALAQLPWTIAGRLARSQADEKYSHA